MKRKHFHKFLTYASSLSGVIARLPLWPFKLAGFGVTVETKLPVESSRLKPILFYFRVNFSKLTMVIPY